MAEMETEKLEGSAAADELPVSRPARAGEGPSSHLPVTFSSWVEVDVGALQHNIAEVRRLVGPSVRVMAVVKADAYGHGARETSKAFEEAGADYLGVTALEEGLELRQAGVGTPILVFSPMLPDQVEAALAADLEQTVCDLDPARAVSAGAEKKAKKARVHVKVDTGMGRLGVTVDDCPDFMYRLLNLPGIEIAGTYTHFADAGLRNPATARRQNSRFSALLDLLAEKDIPTGLRHAANSAALLNIPESHYDMVRPGTVLYGQYPSRHAERRLDLQDTWCLKTRIVTLRKLPSGSKVGYGGEFTASRPTLAAVLPIGYSDGFTLMLESVARRLARPLGALADRLLGGREGPYVIIHGKRAPIIGRVSMQMCSVDVTDIPGVHLGDEVIVPVRRTTTSSRIRRVYIR